MLNREPMGMKLRLPSRYLREAVVSVLNREPMGMKQPFYSAGRISAACFSAQPRADGDEALRCDRLRCDRLMFQCSTASRWG